MHQNKFPILKAKEDTTKLGGRARSKFSLRHITYVIPSESPELHCPSTDFHHNFDDC
jgi:hypothetical protein